jgi:hypothetical protein
VKFFGAFITKNNFSLDFLKFTIRFAADMPKQTQKDKQQVHFWTDEKNAAALIAHADKNPHLGVTINEIARKDTGAVQLRYYTQGITRTELNERMIGFFLSYAERAMVEAIERMIDKQPI